MPTAPFSDKPVLTGEEMLLEERSLSASASSLSSRLLDGAGLRRRLFEDDDSPSSADSSHLASRAACLAALSSSSPRRGEEEDKEAGDSLRCDGDDFDLPSPISFGEQSARTSRGGYRREWVCLYLSECVLFCINNDVCYNVVYICVIINVIIYNVVISKMIRNSHLKIHYFY